MTPADALVTAIKERIAAGLTKEAIKTETVAAGHTEEIFEAAYARATEIPVSELPSFMTLWRAGWQYLRREWRFLVLLASPLVVGGIADVIATDSGMGNEIVLLANIVSLLATLVYFYLMLVLIGAIIQGEDRSDFAAAQAWVKSNGLSLVWVYLVVFLAVIGGYFVFIIPGILLGVWAFFAVYARAVDGHRGLRALQESRRLFKGRFFEVFGKIFGFGLISFAVVFGLLLVGIMMSFALAGVVDELLVLLAVTTLGQIAVAAILMITMQAGFSLYLAARDTATAPAGRLWPYRVFVGIGIIAPVLIGVIIGLWMGFSTAAWIPDEVTNDVTFTLSEAELAALAYAFDNDSFEGVCAPLAEVFATDAVVACNDSVEAWALTVMEGGEQWCVDSTGYQKQLAAPLEERTECLPL